jgi:putative ABC transport system permease protein
MSNRKRAGMIGENLTMAFDVILAHKLRSGLIVLGVAIGVASLMCMTSILLGLKESITNEVSSLQQTILTVQKYDFIVGGFDESMLHRKNISDANAQALREQCQTLSHVAFIIEPSGLPPTLRYKNEKSRMAQIIGTQPALLYLFGLDLEDGRMFTEAEVFHGSKVVVIGHSIRRDLFPNTDPIGKKITINNDSFTIMGTFATRKSMGSGESQSIAMIPYTTYKASMWKEWDSQSVMCGVRPGVPLETARDDVIRVMRAQRKLKANQDNDFAVTSIDAALQLLAKVTAPIALILTAISSIALLVGGIGVMNIMLVSVTERTSEIGIRKAVGAIRNYILWQFLIEAGVLTGLGGVFGIVFGLSIALAISLLSGLPFSLSPVFILLAVAFSISIGMFFGLYPAYRASKLSPIKAIGYAK